jgi:hypothetical protein
MRHGALVLAVALSGAGLKGGTAAPANPSVQLLSDGEIKNAAPANGRCDEAHRRVIVVDGGDIVMVDGIAGTHRQITRTGGADSNPRSASWADEYKRILELFEDNLRTRNGKAT